VGPRTGRDDVERTKKLPIPGLELQPLGLPARSQSLYRLSYPGSLDFSIVPYCHFHEGAIWFTAGTLPLRPVLLYTLGLRH
jgi:hypothetical protein